MGKRENILNLKDEVFSEFKILATTHPLITFRQGVLFYTIHKNVLTFHYLGTLLRMHPYDIKSVYQIKNNIVQCQT